MEQITPKKPYIHVQLTPSTKQFTCVLCGERKTNAKDRQKLVKDGEKTDLYHLIEKLLRITITEEGHSDMCCRNCAGRLTTIEKSLIKFKESYEATRSKLTSTHGHKVYKRSSTEQGGQSKRALSFSQPGTSTDCFTPDQLDGDPRYSLKYEVNMTF